MQRPAATERASRPTVAAAGDAAGNGNGASDRARQAIELYFANPPMSTVVIARLFGVHHSTVSDWIRQLGRQPRGRLEAAHAHREPGRVRQRQELLAAAGACGSPTCDDPECKTPAGKCHANGCDHDAQLAPQTSATWRWVKGHPMKFCGQACTGRTAVESTNAQLTADLAAEERRGYWSVPRTVLELGLSEPVVLKYIASGRLPSERVTAAHGPLLVVPIREAKQLARDRLAPSASSRTKIHTDPEKAMRWAASAGLTAEHVLAYGERVRDRNKRAKKIRLGTGRRSAQGPSARHIRWRGLFELICEEREADHQERIALELPTEPPSDYTIALAVAEHDFREHPEDWQHYPASAKHPDSLDPRFAKAAANRILSAVKPLQNGYRKTRRA